MNRIYLIFAVCLGLSACATTRTSLVGPSAKEGWSKFLGEEVVRIEMVYPDGDAPRNFIELKSGEKRIY